MELNKNQLLFESIKIWNRELKNIEYHLSRMNRSRHELFDKNLPLLTNLDIMRLCGSSLLGLNNNIKKMRIFYNAQLTSFDIVDYKKKEVRTLKKIYSLDAEYPHKYANRSQLDKFHLLRKNCDDVLIIKNERGVNRVTDTTISNIIFFDGEKHITPAQPLLNGTCRQRLLDKKIISCAEILEKDIKNFQSFRLVNAMIDFDEAEEIDVKNIV